MTNLPIDSTLPEIVSALSRSRAVVLVAPPGSGKTTRVPPAILRSGLLGTEHPNLVLLQPRRIAARASAARIAEENAWRLGEEVGYHIRFERRIGPKTRLRVLTEGILTRQLIGDPFLEGVGGVVLDEFHERNLHSDLAIAFLREIRETVRHDIIIVVMSATLDSAPLTRYLWDCPAIRVEAPSFPVELEHLPPAGRIPLPEQVANAVRKALIESASGDVLVFLPGVDEIRRSARMLEPLASAEDLLVLPLHGSLSVEEQDRALRPATRRKIVLATNVAETSLTIDGVCTVIDTGLARFASHDPARGLDRLELGRISRSSAAQRTGRAGRTAPGRCIRLWSHRDERGMPQFDVPEIERVDLSECLLAVHAWGQTDPARFPWYECPPADAIEGAERLLNLLGARDPESGQITQLGKQLFAMPLHPRLGRLLLAAGEEDCLFDGATLAALLAEKDITLGRTSGEPRGGASRPRISSDSDLLVRLDWLDEAEAQRFSPALRDRGIDPAACRRVAVVRDDLLRTARRIFARPDATRQRKHDDDVLLKLILLAYPDRVTRRRTTDVSAGLMVGGRGIRLDPESVVRDSELFVSIDPREDRRGGALEARVRIASAIRQEWLETLFPGAIRCERTIRFDETKGRVLGVETTWYRDLPLREDPHIRVKPGEAANALGEALRDRAEAFFESDTAASEWLTRLRCLRDWMPEGQWPDFGPKELGDLLAMVSGGRRTLDEVRQVPLIPLLQGMMTPAQVRAMDELAPDSVLVPSGSRHRLTYERGRPPVLAVRLQELFGWTDTPRLAGGRVSVVIHLLGPNFRPVQITDDLKSFWATTYFQVRKDLRARYPKHAWPENPLEARPEAKGRARRPPG